MQLADHSIKRVIKPSNIVCSYRSNPDQAHNIFSSSYKVTKSKAISSAPDSPRCTPVHKASHVSNNDNLLIILTA